MPFSIQASDNDANQGLNALENQDIEDELEKQSSAEEEYVSQIQIRILVYPVQSSDC
jgi:hypothetical protein